MTGTRSIASCALSAALLCGSGLQALSAEAGGVALSGSVHIGLKGRIAPKCSLSDMGSRLNFDLSSRNAEARSAALGFTIDCNTPFIYRLSAAHGAMVLQGHRDGEAKAARLPYRISLTVPTEGGVLRADCAGETLSTDAAQGCAADSGHAIAINQHGRMVVSLPSAAGRQEAGDYADYLEFTLSVRQ